MNAIAPLFVDADDAFFEMANVPPRRTGLPFVIFVSQKGGARHDVRVKIGRTAKAIPSEMATVALRPAVHLTAGELTSGDIALLTRWIDLNRDAIIAYWDGNIEYTEDLLAVLKPI